MTTVIMSLFTLHTNERNELVQVAKEKKITIKETIKAKPNAKDDLVCTYLTGDEQALVDLVNKCSYMLTTYKGHIVMTTKHQ